MLNTEEIKELLNPDLSRKGERIETVESYGKARSKATIKLEEEYWEAWSKYLLSNKPLIRQQFHF